MKQSKTLTAALLACGFALSGSVFAGTPSAEMLSYTCAGCHGGGGVSEGPAIPSLAGMSTEYFTEAMQEYKNGERPATIMGRIAKGYSEEESKLMAGYFAKQKFVAAKQSSDAGLAKKGAKLHDKYCEKCHAEGGTSAEDDAGILAGQWTPYLQYTMEDYISGKREMTKKMKKKVKKLQKKEGDAGMTALYNFYSSAK
jgi:sulfide dehydrogenase cytochrome subunit